MRKLLFALFLVILSLPISGKDIRILAIGNSFSEDAVEQNLYELALEGGDKLIIGNAYRGGQGLESHWNVVNNNQADFEYRKVVDGKRTNNTGKTLLDCIKDEAWDYITFQQVSQDAGKLETYDPYLGYLLDYVKKNVTNSNVKYGLHQTWAYAKNSTHGGFANYGNNQETMYNAIVSTINSVKENHAADITFIIPAGTAIQNGRTSFIGDNFNRDGYHLDYGVGRYTAACTWLEAITGKNPVGMKFKPTSINDVVAQVAQTAAHDAVLKPNEVTSLTNMGYAGDNITVPAKPIKVNFGSTNQLQGWNNVSENAAYVIGLKDTEGADTEIIAALDDSFNGTNTEGVQPTTTELDMPTEVSKTCLWGYAQGNFENKPQQPTGGFSFSHLNKDLAYDFCIFGSRKGVSDNREAMYTLSGSNVRKGYLNTAANGTKTITIKGVRPDANGVIKLTVAPGSNNTNGNKFYYINALQIVAREATSEDDLNKISDSRDLLGMDRYTDYVLTNDIDMSGVTVGEGVLDTYSGTLDGRGHVIYGLKIDKSESGELGMFRHLRGGTIKNLGIEGASILGNANVGAFVGQSHGGVIQNCYIANSIVSGRDHVGAIVGQLEGENGTVSQIVNCYAAANVYSRDNQAGGLAGTSTAGGGTILNSYFSGRVEVVNQRIGGIMALQDSDHMLTIENCATLAAQLKCNRIYRIASTKADKSTLKNNYALETLHGTEGTEIENGIDVTAERAKQQDFYTTDLKWTFDDSNWKWVEGAYPVLAWQNAATTVTPLVYLSQSAPALSLKQEGSIDLSTYYASGLGAALTYSCDNVKIHIEGSTVSIAEGMEITDLETVTISASVAGFKAAEIKISLVPGIISITTADDFITKVTATPSGSFKLTADLDFTGKTFNGIENFTGQLDGNGFIIKNLNIQRSGEGRLGLFLSTNNAEIKNVGIESSVIGTNDNKHIGAFVGEMNGGTISGCYVANSRIVGKDHVGALVGQLKTDALMSNCYSTAYVQTTSWQVGGLVGSIEKATVDKSYFSGVVVGKDVATGGLVGLKNGGDATNTTVKNSANMASYIVGNNNPKRIMGSDGIKLENNYSLASARVGKNVSEAATITSTDAAAQEGADMTAEEARTASFYAETLQWDMTDTWSMPEGGAYPVLKWQLDRNDKLQWNIYEGVDVLPAKITRQLFLSVDTYDLNRFIASNGLTLNGQSDNTDVVSVVGTLVTPKATSGSAIVTVSAPEAVKDKFVEVSVTLSCLIVPETGVIELETPTDLLKVTAFPAREFKLKNDINMTDISFNGLCSESAPFTGIFDGDGYTITGLKFNEAGTTAMGLFRKIKGATVKRVNLTGVNFVGNENIAGIAGLADGGKIELCSVKSSYIEGRDRTAGIAAHLTNNAIIENCYVADSQIKSREHQAGGIGAATMEGGAKIRNCYFEGTIVSQYGHVGSMLGLIDRDADVTIENCLNLASSITGGTPYRICSWGGKSAFAHFTNNYSISTTTGCKTDADDRNGTTLPNDADVKSLAFYTGTLNWDFSEIWKIEEGEGYPVFRTKNDPVGVVTEKIADNLVVNSITGGIEIIVNQPQRVNVYGIDGRLVYSAMLSEGRNTVTGIASGLYIVNRIKVVVK